MHNFYKTRYRNKLDNGKRNKLNNYKGNDYEESDYKGNKSDSGRK
jgi:hypothetical protein